LVSAGTSEHHFSFEGRIHAVQEILASRRFIGIGKAAHFVRSSTRALCNAPRFSLACPLTEEVGKKSCVKDLPRSKETLLTLDLILLP
jgi:hypothetical protein